MGEGWVKAVSYGDLLDQGFNASATSQLYNSESSCIAHGAGELGVSNPGGDVSTRVSVAELPRLYHCIPPWTTGTMQYKVSCHRIDSAGELGVLFSYS